MWKFKRKAASLFKKQVPLLRAFTKSGSMVNLPLKVKFQISNNEFASISQRLTFDVSSIHNEFESRTYVTPKSLLVTADRRMKEQNMNNRISDLFI
jgi:hypothetical protein